MHAQPFVIRPAQEDDLPALLALETAYFAHPWTAENLLTEIRKPAGCFLVALRQASPVGYVSAVLVPPEAFVNNLAVAEPCRGRGVATALMRRLENACADAGVTAVKLEVRCGNTAARSLYRSLGYVSDGVRPGFYRDPPDDAALMTHVLTD